MQNFDNITKRLDSIMGCDDFKSFCRSLPAVYGSFPDTPLPPALLIPIDRGAGFTELCEIYSEFLKVAKPFSDHQAQLTEHELTKGNEKINNLNSTYNLLDELNSQVIAIDISDWTGNKLYDPYFTKTLRKMFDMTHERGQAFVFRMPFADEAVMDKVLDRLAETLHVILINPGVPTNEMLVEYLEGKLCKALSLPHSSELSDGLRKLVLSTRTGRFRYYATMDNLCRGIQFSIVAEGGSNRKTALSAVYDMLLPDVKIENGRDKLDSLVGMKLIKEKVEEITASILFHHERGNRRGENRERPNLHMIYSGAPGTGKTIVARIMGKIMREEGILPNGDLLEVTRKDLVGEFIGQTALKTANICKAAIGNVLFIDEAYALVNDTAERHDFGFEAVSTLMTELENHRGEFICIMAGYEEELERLFELNPGLKSRFAYKLDFPNYTRQELSDIYFYMTDGECIYSPETRAEIELFFSQIDPAVFDSKSFANARFVRNLSERVMGKAYLRLSKLGLPPVGGKIPVTISDFKEAYMSKDIQRLLTEKSKNRIGFGADNARIRRVHVPENTV